MGLQEQNCIAFAVVQVIPCQPLCRQPVAPDRAGKLSASLYEIRLRQVMCKAFANHHESAGAVFLDIAGEKERLADARVAGYGAMGFAKTFRGKRRSQRAGIPYFHAVGKDVNLYGSCRGIVAVGNGIDNSFSYYIRWDFITDGCLYAFSSGSNTEVNF